MIIKIEGDSQDINYRRLATHLRHFNKKKEIDINVNGLKFKGKMSKIAYKEVGISKLKVIEIDVII